MENYYVGLICFSLILLIPLFKQVYIELTESDREALWRIYCDNLGYDPNNKLISDFNTEWTALRLWAIPRKPPGAVCSGSDDADHNC